MISETLLAKPGVQKDLEYVVLRESLTTNVNNPAISQVRKNANRRQTISLNVHTVSSSWYSSPRVTVRLKK
ncbi:hypothetical protein BpHYR1_006926 [Brachionus plicatilis]|uniref:Uncharacterized protein n=1 Tax=Brachionus plicatilis TaxID=10195 RepID=A0A3M7PZD7_BRAPC|nr:hypothetical protein BpHYR1_006926 [Brachionus plicatilis]